jgi:hypothetical protein
MDAIPFCAGAFMKVVDEIEDVGILNLEEYKEYFQTLCILFITLWMYSDPYISASWISLIIPASYYINQIDSNFWKSLIPIPFITLLLTANIEKPILSDIAQKIAYIVFACFFILLEEKLTPEESSIYKILFRVLIILGSLGIIYLTSELSSAEFIKSCSLFIIGYCTLSVISKSFFSEPISKEIKEKLLEQRTMSGI